MLQLLHYQENNENKGSQMGHTKKNLTKVLLNRKIIMFEQHKIVTGSRGDRSTMGPI
jgi:hypothetical protein